MAEYVRVATFEADNAALDALVSEINSSGGAPDGVPATRITVLADRSAGRVVVSVRFASEQDLRKGSEALDALSPPAGSVRRTAVAAYEVVLERDA
jgi:hypothetical protein